MIHGVPKETMEYMIRLFSPTMDDYLYVLDLKEDYYMISPQAIERFRLPGDHFYHARETHRTFVYAEDQKILWDDIDKICAGQAENHNLDSGSMQKNVRTACLPDLSSVWELMT